MMDSILFNNTEEGYRYKNKGRRDRSIQGQNSREYVILKKEILRRKMVVVTSCFVLLCVCLGCGTQSKYAFQDYDKQSYQIEHSQILFIGLNFQGNGVDTRVDLTQSFRRQGNLKPMRENFTLKKGDFKCYFLNSQEEIVDSVLFQNPLKRQVEWSEPGGKLSTREIELESAEHYLRITWKSSIKTLKIHQLSEDMKLNDAGIFEIRL